MADGKVVIAADMDDTPANKKLMKLRDTVEKLENDFNSKSQKKTALEEELKTAKWAADDAREAVRGLNEEKKQLEAQREGINPSSMEYQNVSAQIVEIDRRYKEAKVALNENVREAARLEKELNKVSDSAAKVETKLNASKTELGQMEAKLAYQNSFWGRINKGAKDAEKSVGKLGSRIAGLVKSAFVFSVITMGLQKVREYMSKTLQKNVEFQSSLASLKGALLTAFQPIYNVIVPALITLMKVITTVITAIAHLFSLFSGGSAKQNAADAKALNAKADAIGAVGGAASKAEKQLASFDEINQLSDTSSGGGGGGGGAGGGPADLTPDFSGIDELTDKMRILRDLVAMIGGAILGWKLAKFFGLAGKEAAGLTIAFAGLALMITGVADAWKNGLNWKNMLEILGGAALLTLGLGMAFGTAGIAIGLMVSGIVLLITAIKDIATNGLNLYNTIALIVGVLAICLGIFIKTHNIIPLIIATIAGLVAAFVTLMGHGTELAEGIETAFGGLIKFINGVFAGDMDLALQGIGELFAGLKEIISSIIASIMDLFTGILDWIDEKTGGRLKPWFETIGNLFSGLFDGFKQVLNGIIEFITGVFNNDWDKAWDGIKGIFKGIWNGIVSLLEGAVNFIINGVNALIKGLNKVMNFKLPDWLGGAQIGISIPEITTVSLPRLAQGAVIPPNREFLAVLGDQRSGTNIEAPLDTIVQAFRLAMNDMNGMQNEAVLYIGEQEMGKLIYRLNNQETRRIGVSLTGV